MQVFNVLFALVCLAYVDAGGIGYAYGGLSGLALKGHPGYLGGAYLGLYGGCKPSCVKSYVSTGHCGSGCGSCGSYLHKVCTTKCVHKFEVSGHCGSGCGICGTILGSCLGGYGLAGSKLGGYGLAGYKLGGYGLAGYKLGGYGLAGYKLGGSGLRLGLKGYKSLYGYKLAPYYGTYKYYSAPRYGDYKSYYGYPYSGSYGYYGYSAFPSYGYYGYPTYGYAGAAAALGKASLSAGIRRTTGHKAEVETTVTTRVKKTLECEWECKHDMKCREQWATVHAYSGHCSKCSHCADLA